MRGQWRSISVIFALEMLSTPLSLLAPIGIKIAIDNVLGGKPLPHILRAALPASFLQSSERLLMVAVAVQIGVALLIQARWFCSYLLKIHAGERMLLNFRSRVYAHALALPLGYHDERGSADSAFRIQDDASALRTITIDGALFLISDIVKLLSMACVTLLIDWRLGFVALSVAPLLSLQALLYERRVGGRYKEVKKMESFAFQAVHETLSILRVVKAFVQERAEERRFWGRARDASGARIRLGYADGIFGFAVNLTTSMGMAMVLLVGIRNIEAGVLTLGSLLMVITYLAQLYAPLQNITYHLASLKASAASVDRALEVFAAKPESANSLVAVRTRPRQFHGSIDFQNVTFAYGSSAPILNDFSFEIPPGSRVGLVGKTGAGKTTLVNLLVRFVSPQSGRILLDGHDIQHIGLPELRRQFAFVLQEPVLFATTVAQNIAYGNPEASREEIVRAAIAAQAHDFICSLPNEYETNVGERGSLLSGGERQRVSIARAFLLDSPVLIMDEPTSSVDVTTEAEVLRAMQRLSAGRTCFFVSHRPGTLANCDFVFRLRQGEPLEVCVCDSETDFEALLRGDELEPVNRVHLA